jgi:fumarylacetoacetate (FAA) hydrolase
MRLATLPGSGPDGRLVVVSRDGAYAVAATSVAATLLEALGRWDAAEPALRGLAETVEDERAPEREALDVRQALAPLPRTWQWLDGSTFEAHLDLVEEAYRLPPIPRDRPLMYQGLSHCFLAPHEDVVLPREEDGIDFEGEFAVITDDVPMGVSAEQARAHIRLVVQVNDWSLRVPGEAEMKTGFGWIQGKPACSMAPFAVTPDELGEAWVRARVALPLWVHWNGQLFGAPNGEAMGFGFDELIAHAAGTRSLCAGTLIGSGTVSNPDFRRVGSTCIAERRGIEVLDLGAARTSYMRFGDRVRMEAGAGAGAPFGIIDQQVRAP